VPPPEELGPELRRISLPITMWAIPAACCREWLATPSERVWLLERLRVSAISAPFFTATLHHPDFKCWGPIALDVVGESALPCCKLVPGEPLRVEFMNVDTSAHDLLAVLDLQEVVG
jgi:hypothetical protein